MSALLVSLFSVLQAWHDYQNVQTRLHQDASRAVALAREEIGHYLQEQRRTLQLFARDDRRLIEALAVSPGDERLHKTLQSRVRDYFPDAFAFSLVDPAGHERVVDFDGLVGDLCRTNITALSHSGAPQPLMVHPHPDGYHFDVMIPWSATAKGREVFFVSFRLTRLARILQINENLGFRLFLLRTDDPGLIELGSAGSRLELGREEHLSPDEWQRVQERQTLPGSLWEVVSLPDQAMQADMTGGIVWGLVRTLSILWLVAFLLATSLNRKERQLALRRASEAALRESNQQLYERATHDGLTGLANRHRLEEALERALRSCAREHRPLCVAMIDVDHFKDYNDGLGHRAGDDCLRAVAGILGQTCRRPEDLVGRYGGEEFLMILPDTDLPTAEAVMELTRARLRALGLAHPRGRLVTFSAGVACMVPDHEPEAGRLLVEAADQALYRAKHAGRDRIEGGRSVQAPPDSAGASCVHFSAAVPPVSPSSQASWPNCLARPSACPAGASRISRLASGGQSSPGAGRPTAAKNRSPMVSSVDSSNAIRRAFPASSSRRAPGLPGLSTIQRLAPSCRRAASSAAWRWPTCRSNVSSSRNAR